MGVRVVVLHFLIIACISFKASGSKAADYWQHLEAENRTTPNKEPDWLTNLRNRISAKGPRNIPAPNPSKSPSQAGTGVGSFDYWQSLDAATRIAADKTRNGPAIRQRTTTTQRRSAIPALKPYGPSSRAGEGVRPIDHWRALEAENTTPTEKPKWHVDLQYNIATKGHRVVHPQNSEASPSWTKRRTDGEYGLNQVYDDPLLHRPRAADFKAPWQEEWEKRSRQRSDQEYALGDTLVGRTALPNTGQSYHQMAKNPVEKIYIGSEEYGETPSYEDYGPDTKRLGDIYDPTQKLEALKQQPQKKEIRNYEPSNPREMHNVHDYQDLYLPTDKDYYNLSLAEIDAIVMEELDLETES